MSMIVRLAAVAPRASRAAAFSGVRLAHTLNDRERAAEAAFFNREEEKLMKNLLNKMKAQQSAAAQKEAKTKEMAALNAIVGSKLTDAEKDKLVQWRHSTEY